MLPLLQKLFELIIFNQNSSPLVGPFCNKCQVCVFRTSHPDHDQVWSKSTGKGDHERKKSISSRNVSPFDSVL